MYKERKKDNTKVDPPLLDTDILRNYPSIIEDTLLFHLWLKKDKILKADFEIYDNNVDSRAMNCIKYYLEPFQNNVIRKVNKLKTPKCHQILNVCGLYHYT